MAPRTARIAANPIPYWSKAGKTREVFDQAFSDFSRIGFTAVKADIPEGMSVAEYRSWIDGYGLAPALSLFNSPFDETVEADAEVERARRFAADQAALGLDRTMVSSTPMAARMARPAVGAGFEEERLARAIDLCGRVCVALQEEGLRPLHHSHVGGVFETEGEIVRLLEELGPDVIGVGPDTGHLRWVGVDPVDFVRRYADRIGGIHLKDLFPDHLGARTGAMPYRQTADTKRLWAEPGLGVVDLDAVVAALPEDFDGDLMIEVDEPSVATPAQSHQISFAWAQQALAGVSR